MIKRELLGKGDADPFCVFVLIFQGISVSLDDCLDDCLGQRLNAVPAVLCSQGRKTKDVFVQCDEEPVTTWLNCTSYKGA